jgi:hypothetical protein
VQYKILTQYNLNVRFKKGLLLEHWMMMITSVVKFGHFRAAGLPFTVQFIRSLLRGHSSCHLPVDNDILMGCGKAGCGFVGRFQRFGETYSLHPQGLSGDAGKQNPEHYHHPRLRDHLKSHILLLDCTSRYVLEACSHLLEGRVETTYFSTPGVFLLKIQFLSSKIPSFLL